MLLVGGPSDQRSAWPKDLTKISTCPKASPNWGVHLTRGQPDWSSNTWPQDGAGRGFILPKVSLNQRSDKNVNLTQNLNYGGSIWLSAKRTSENVNTLCILGLALGLICKRPMIWLCSHTKRHLTQEKWKILHYVLNEINNNVSVEWNLEPIISQFWYSMTSKIRLLS